MNDFGKKKYKNKKKATRVMKKYRIKIDRDTCIGCMACVNSAPDLFELDDEGKSHPKKEIITEEELEKAELARDSCPLSCITIEEVNDE